MSGSDTLIVTGASKGLGRHICQRAMECGYAVIGLSRSAIDMKGLRAEIACDVSDPEQIETALKPYRRDTSIYGVINAAGIASMNMFIGTPTETMARLINVNLLGTMAVTKALAPALIKRKQGRIINFSTIAVPLGIAGETSYAASKGGVETFSRAVARELSPYGITVNTVAPGPIATNLTAKVPSDKIQKIVDQQIIPIHATPEDVWNIVSLLLSPQANMISGEVLHVGGA